MRRAIVGTAGHIDHGKTRLVEALTGTDCDRWVEEKRRGITIDLGFAHLERDDVALGFVDVPGHERFLHNALAGLGGIRIMLLVVAADEGVKPQTREHLDICSLLGIPAGVVALTKADLATADLLELARLEVDELLAPTPFAGCRILPVSSATGEGVAELAAELAILARRHAVAVDPSRPTRLPVDRAFHLKGLGVVATGTLASGVVRPGDELEVLPGGGRARVRSVQVHGRPRAEAAAGERTALQLAGVELGALARGSELAAPGAFAPATSLLVRLRLLPSAPAPLAGWTAVRVHLHTAEVVGRLRPLRAQPLAPGGEGPAELRLEEPVTAARGDRFVVRRPSPAATLGGGEILDPRWLRLRAAALAAALPALAGGADEAVLEWVREAGEGGAEAAELARRLGQVEEAVRAGLARLAACQRILAVETRGGHRWIAPAAYQRVARRAKRVLAEYFRAERLASGMPKAEAVARILRGRGAELTETYLGWLTAQKVLVVAGDRVTLPGRAADLTGEESRLAREALARFDAAGLTPPSPGEVRQALDAKPQILDGVLKYLVRQRALAQLPGGLLIAASAVARLREDLLATGWDRFSVPRFKDRFGLTRKWAIPLLEHLDSIGATRRLGDERQVVRRAEAAGAPDRPRVDRGG